MGLIEESQKLIEAAHRNEVEALKGDIEEARRIIDTISKAREKETLRAGAAEERIIEIVKVANERAEQIAGMKEMLDNNREDMKALLTAIRAVVFDEDNADHERAMLKMILCGGRRAE